MPETALNALKTTLQENDLEGLRQLLQATRSWPTHARGSPDGITRLLSRPRKLRVAQARETPAVSPTCGVRCRM